MKYTVEQMAALANGSGRHSEAAAMMRQMRIALALPDAEPVAWIHAATGAITLTDKRHTVSWAPLYAATPAPEKLTDDEINAFVGRSDYKNWDDVVRRIEAAIHAKLGAKP